LRGTLYFVSLSFVAKMKRCHSVPLRSDPYSKTPLQLPEADVGDGEAATTGYMDVDHDNDNGGYVSTFAILLGS
jgi:hypothetical protein